ncbi:ParB/RepB/Spo0J family partition protein [Brevundimonas bacteroides]|uniref:ParB/RepB/Spo0J family partition protein n=1 Tax=Brevundimonas bacteroides TaxID=74311 RepID=UPI00068BF7C7|nr:ParB/RepB/Spo0J family partition protein [Brevundimonas bacteroides]
MSITLTPLAVESRPVLEALQSDQVPDTVNGLAKLLDRDPSNLRRSLKGLTAEGWILASAETGRPYVLTDAGSQALAGMRVAEGAASAGLPPLTREQIAPDPDQPRKAFDPDALQELAESIADRGLQQPLLVRMTGDGSAQLVAGERRWRAIGLLIAAADPRWPADRHVPYHLSAQADAAEILADQVVENVQRAGLHPLEEAEAFQTLKAEHGWGVGRISKTVGKTRRFVEQRLDLLLLTPAQRDRMRLPRDHADHLTASRAREMIQQLRQISGAAAEQRDIEEIAPGEGVAAVSADAEAAARKPKLTARELMVLGEIAAAAAARPSARFPDIPGPIVDVDFAQAVADAGLRNLDQSGLVATLLDADAEGSFGGARVEDLGHLRLRLENLHPAHNPRALFHLRREAGISADQARQLNALQRWATPFLNAAHTAATADANPATPESAPAKIAPALPDYIERWSAPFAGPAGHQPYGAQKGSDWHSPAERLILLELADKCLAEPETIEGQAGWTIIGAEPTKADLGGLHGGIVELGSVRRLFSTKAQPVARLHFSAGTANESGGIHGALTRLGFYSDRQGALAQARQDAGYSGEDLQILEQGGLYATPWLNVAKVEEPKAAQAGQRMECPVVNPAWRLPWITIQELQDTAGNVGYRAHVRHGYAQTIEASEYLPNPPLALGRVAEGLQRRFRALLPADVMAWLDQLQGEHFVNGIDYFSAARASEARAKLAAGGDPGYPVVQAEGPEVWTQPPFATPGEADDNKVLGDLTEPQIRILREVGHALEASAAGLGEPVAVGQYWLDADAVALWKRAPDALLLFSAQPGEPWTVQLTEAGRNVVRLLNAEMDPLALAMRIDREGYSCAWLRPVETPIGEQLGEAAEAEDVAEESQLLIDVRAEIAAGAPDPEKLFRLVGLVGDFAAGGDAQITLTPHGGGRIVELAVADPDRAEPEDLAIARAELIAFALNALARNVADAREAA